MPENADERVPTPSGGLNASHSCLRCEDVSQIETTLIRSICRVTDHAYYLRDYQFIRNLRIALYTRIGTKGRPGEQRERLSQEVMEF